MSELDVPLPSTPRDPEPSLQARLEDVERGLSLALADYRSRAEEVLAKHTESLESMERARQLEVANLRAENGMLRDQLGLDKLAEPALFQTVMFSANESPANKSRTPKSRARPGGSKSSTNLCERDKLLNTRKARGKNGDQEPGGSWQQFVAWVPNGCALKAPEPWKPLPQQVLPQQHPQRPGGAPPMLGVVPGAVHSEDVDTESQSTTSVKSVAREDFQVLEMWKVSRSSLSKMRKSANAADGESRYTKDRSVYNADEEDQNNAFEEEPHDWWIIHPHSRIRIVWDVLSLIMVVYDMVTIPMTFFDLPEDSTFLQAMNWATRIFWTIDMIWSSCTAVIQEDGSVKFSQCFIIKRYLKTWFALDLAIVGSDWTMAALAESGDLAFIGLTRIFRIARVVRLLRLVRMQEVIASITERIQSDKIAILISILKMTVFVVSASHLIACIWWGIGARSSDGPTWVSQSEYDAASLESKYLVSLHWSLAQFTGGMDEITPASSLERFYATAVWVLGFMASAIMVSTMTSNQTQLHIIGGGQSRQLAQLRKYLKQNAISSNLALRVQRSAQHAMSGELTQDAVELLAVVSEPLKIEMHFMMYTSVLRFHPFFCDFIHERPQLLRRICHFALSTMHLYSGDIVFARGEEPQDPKMYFVWRGCLSYAQGAWDATPVKERQWIAEAVLWTRWKHRGTLTASCDSKLAVLDARAFQDLGSRHRGEGGTFDPKLYAADFVDHLNQTDELDDLTSLCMRP